MNAPYRLIQITDLHLRQCPGDILASGLDTDRSLRGVLTDILEREGPATTVLVTGDLVQDPVRTAYERLCRILLAYPFHYFCLPGNHDDPWLMREVLSGPQFSTESSGNLGEWGLVMLDSTVAGKPHGCLGESEILQLRKHLAGAVGRNVLVALHHQPVPVRSPWIDRMALTDSGALFKALSENAKVRAVLFGHVHQEFDQEEAGIRLLATPSTCVQFRPGAPTFDLDALGPAWRWLDLHQDGRVETDVRYLSGVRLQQSA